MDHNDNIQGWGFSYGQPSQSNSEPEPDFEIEILPDPEIPAEEKQQEPCWGQPQEPYAAPQQTVWEQSVAAPERKKKSWKGVVAAVLVLVLVVGSCACVAWVMEQRFEARFAQQEEKWEEMLDGLEQPAPTKGEEKAPVIQQGGTVVAVEGQTPAQVYADNADKVVLIKSQVAASGFSSGGYSTGSGFFLTADGYVVTNYHVVEGGSRFFVVTANNQQYEATLVGADNANDVALLKVEGSDFPAVTLGDSDALTVGDQVVAIGNPLGELTSTLTVGYVSAKERDVNTSGFAINMIQTDAAINSGNSGGPLFNMAGQVIGITTAKYSGSSSSGATIEGIGFAIPINDVAKILEDLATKGYVSGGYLGVSVSDMDAEAADYYGMPVGAYVKEVVAGSCAQRAGIQPKDIITAVGERKVESVNELSRALRDYKAGDTVEITLYRGGAEKTVKVTLDERPRED